jgi:hypothetical protein
MRCSNEWNNGVAREVFAVVAGQEGNGERRIVDRLDSADRAEDLQPMVNASAGDEVQVFVVLHPANREKNVRSREIPTAEVE